MFKTLSSNASSRLLNADAIRLIDEINEFQSHQISEENLLTAKFPEIIPLAYFKVRKGVELLGSNAFFRTGSTLILTKRLFESVSRMRLPLYQKYSCKLVSGSQEVEAVLLYFYLDYFRYVDFQNTTFTSYRERFGSGPTDRGPVVDVISSTLKFSEIAEYFEFDREKGSIKLKVNQLHFNKKIYDLDLIPSIHLDHRLIISEGLGSLVQDSPMVELFECLVPISC